MKLWTGLLLFIAFSAYSSTAQLATYRTELDMGVKAYRAARYEDAITHFKQAVSAAPDQFVAHLYLATAYAQQYIPGVDVPDNTANGESAIAEFERALTLNPPRESQIAAMKGIASLYFNMKKFDLARQAHLKVTEVDPQDPEAYYAIGIIDWTESYTIRMEQRAKLNLKPEVPLIDKEVCWKVRTANQDRVKDGIEMLSNALSRRKDYDDAMAYMNLMYRERADIQCGDQQAYNADTRTADQWVDLTLATKNHKVEGAHPHAPQP